jgi:hypothetical protein
MVATIWPARPFKRRNFFGARLAIDDSSGLDLSYRLLATKDLNLLVRCDEPDLFARNIYRSFKRRLSGGVLDGHPSKSAPASDNQLRANSFRDREVLLCSNYLGDPIASRFFRAAHPRRHLDLGGPAARRLGM